MAKEIAGLLPVVVDESEATGLVDGNVAVKAPNTNEQIVMSIPSNGLEGSEGVGNPPSGGSDPSGRIDYSRKAFRATVDAEVFPYEAVGVADGVTTFVRGRVGFIVIAYLGQGSDEKHLALIAPADCSGLIPAITTVEDIPQYSYAEITGAHATIDNVAVIRKPTADSLVAARLVIIEGQTLYKDRIMYVKPAVMGGWVRYGSNSVAIGNNFGSVSGDYKGTVNNTGKNNTGFVIGCVSGVRVFVSSSGGGSGEGSQILYKATGDEAAGVVAAQRAQNNGTLDGNTVSLATITPLTDIKSGDYVGLKVDKNGVPSAHVIFNHTEQGNVWFNTYRYAYSSPNFYQYKRKISCDGYGHIANVSDEIQTTLFVTEDCDP